MDPLNYDETEVLNDDLDEILSDEDSVDVDPNELSEENNKNVVLEFLTDQGFRPRLDTDGDIALKVEGYNVYLSIRWDFLECKLFANYWDADLDRQEYLELVNEVNAERNLTKVSLTSWGLATFVIGNFVSSHVDLTHNLTVKLEWIVSAKRFLDYKVKEKIEAKNNALDQQLGEDPIAEVDETVEPNDFSDEDSNMDEEI